MKKVDRDPKMVQLVMRVAEEVSSDISISVQDRVTRLRAAITFGRESDINVSKLELILTKLETL